MIGNDVVDLQLALQNKNWKSRRFMDKLFSENEKSIIFNFENPAQAVWLLWSMKEAAYKAHQRQFNLKRTYNPLFFECFGDFLPSKQLKTMVFAGKTAYYCNSFFDFEKVHSIALASEGLQNNFKLLKASSATMKSNFIQQISKTKNLSSAKLSLGYNEHRIPQLYKDSEATNTAFSFSHHGNYSAFAFALNNF